MGMKAVVFPGQGSQYQGMGKDFYDNFSQAKDLFSYLDELLDFKISRICFYGKPQELKRTYFQQLAILATSLVAYELFKSKNIKIDYFSGLSIGECTALYPAGVLELKELVFLVKERAKAMEEASNAFPSCMLAVIGMERNVLEEKSRQLDFYLSNINSPVQIVISLKKENRERIKESLQNLGAKVVELEVSGGFHSPFMQPAKEVFKRKAEKMRFNSASTPIVSNFTACAHTDGEEIKRNIIEQLTSPVLWKNCIELMIEKGVDTFFEIGPSRILQRLIKRINPSVEIINIEKKEDLERL